MASLGPRQNTVKGECARAPVRACVTMVVPSPPIPYTPARRAHPHPRASAAEDFCGATAKKSHQLFSFFGQVSVGGGGENQVGSGLA